MYSLLEKYRITEGLWATKEDANHGMFILPSLKLGDRLKVVCAHMGELDWDHVSVSVIRVKTKHGKEQQLPVKRCPTWEEMSNVKSWFWGADETVIQFHPKKSEYKNLHPYCLHLWKNRNGHKLPPSILVAP